MINCPRCGKELKDTAKYCENCGVKLSQIKHVEGSRSGLLTASSVFLFMSSGLLLFFAIFTLINHITDNEFLAMATEDELLPIYGSIYALIGVVIGIIAGISMLEQRRLSVSIAGIITVMLGSFMIGWVYAVEELLMFFVIGFPGLFFSTLALIFTSVRYKDFRSV